MLAAALVDSRRSNISILLVFRKRKKEKENESMKATCERDKLLHAFQMAASVAPARSPKPILQNVKLEVGGKGRF